MAFEIGDVMRAVAKISMPQDVEAQNVWDWERTDSEVTSPTAAAVQDEINTKLQTMYAAIEGSMANSVTVQVATYYVMQYVDGAWVVASLLGDELVGITGLDTDEVLPHGIAGLITLGTTKSRSRGRRFLPGFSEGQCDAGVFNTTTLGRMLDMAAAYLLDITMSGGYTLSARLLTESGFTRIFSSYAADGTPAYQRRRKPGVGS